VAANAETALATLERDDALALTPISDAQGAKARLVQLQAFVQSVMVEGHDFGTIPGTDKPTLYKPGAEKLLEMYGLAATYDVTQRIEDWERGFWAYEVRCRITSRRDGGVVGEGVGSCNSMETRYRWRTEWSNVPEHQTPPGDGWRLVYVKKQGRKVWQRRVENEDRWDLPNTLLKMAKKRGQVDATLSVTRSSGLFTQDMEDLARREEDDDDDPAPRNGARIQANGGAAVAAAAVEDARACPSCDQPMVLRSGTTRDGRPYSAWFCAARCGQKPIWLSERKADAPATATRQPAKAVQGEIVPPAVTADRLLSAAETRRLRDDVTATFRSAGWKDDETRAAVARRLAELGLQSAEQLKLHASHEFRRWAEEAAAGAAPAHPSDSLPVPADADEAAAAFAELGRKE
jgi:hypothetical protein